MIILCSLCGSARRWLNVFLQFFNREKHSQVKEKERNISESRSGNMESMVLMSMVPYLIWTLKLGFEKKRETLLWGEEQTQKAGTMRTIQNRARISPLQSWRQPGVIILMSQSRPRGIYYLFACPRQNCVDFYARLKKVCSHLCSRDNSLGGVFWILRR